MVVEDATKEPRFASNPNVTVEGGVRFYLGVPIHSPGRHPIGTLCVFDFVPRVVRAGDLESLIDLAAMVDEIIGARQRANADQLTGLQNRRGFDLAALQLLGLADRANVVMALGYFDLDGLKTINDSLGHEVGDLAIQVAGRLLAECFRSADVVARLGGDESAVLFAATLEEGAQVAAQRLKAAIAARNDRGDLPFQLAIAAGIVQRLPGGPALDELLGMADSAMYKVKRSTAGA